MSIKFDRNENGELFTEQEKILLDYNEAKNYMEEELHRTAVDLLTGNNYVAELRKELIKEMREDSKIKEQEFEQALEILSNKIKFFDSRINTVESRANTLETTINSLSDRLNSIGDKILEKENDLKKIGKSFKGAFKYVDDLDNLVETLEAVKVLFTNSFKQEETNTSQKASEIINAQSN